jgi:anaerobic selenocysteine-containing dehydrogenase
MTNPWTDIKNTDLVVIMGGNAAEAHPCGFKWVTEAKANRGARLIVVDPRYTRSASVADVYAPIRQGTDIAFLLGVVNYCIKNNKVQWDYVKAFTNAAYLVKDGFAYHDGLFTGYDEKKRDYDKSISRAMRSSACSQEIRSNVFAPGLRSIGYLSRVSALTKSSSAAPFGQSVPRLVGWSVSPSMWMSSAGSPFFRSPFEYMMMPHATEQ